MAVTFRVLGPVVAEHSGRRLELGTVRQRDDHVDALVFAAAVGRAVRADHDGDWTGALAAAGDGLARWRGPALVDVHSVPYAPGASARLDGQRARVEPIRLRALVKLGRAGGGPINPTITDTTGSRAIRSLTRPHARQRHPHRLGSDWDGVGGYSSSPAPVWVVSCITQNMAPAGSTMPAMRP